MFDDQVEIIPVFFRFTSHERLEVPLEAHDEVVVSKWLDDGIVDFATA